MEDANGFAEDAHGGERSAYFLAIFEIHWLFGSDTGGI